jgi:hypothetical protein
MPATTYRKTLPTGQGCAALYSRRRERPTSGWGRNGIHLLEGMASIDNAYLQVALTFGVYALGLSLAILVWTPIRLIVFGAKFPNDSPEHLNAYTLLAIYVLIAISRATVCLGLQTEIFSFYSLLGAIGSYWDRVPT